MEEKKNGRNLLMTEEELQKRNAVRQEKANEDLERKLEQLEEEGVPKTKPRKKWSQKSKDDLSRTLIQFYKDHPEKRVELSEKIKKSWGPEGSEERQRQSTKMTKVLAKGSPAHKAMLAGMKKHWDEYHAWKKEKAAKEG